MNGINKPMTPLQEMAQPGNKDNIMNGISKTGVVKKDSSRDIFSERFVIIKKLGRGSSGKVELGVDQRTGQAVAIKTIKLQKIEEDSLKRKRRELDIMMSVQHPNVIHIHEILKSLEKIVVVMEVAAGGDLCDYMSKRGVLTDDEARRIFRQISAAVYYCHKHNICHRDLNLKNILLDKQATVKIADFGWSRVFDDKKMLATFCGSNFYASPEILQGKPYRGPEIDCWSLGVILYAMVYGNLPFSGSNYKRLVEQVKNGAYHEPENRSPASPLIKAMLTVSPDSRATIKQICSHRWLNIGYTNSCLDLAEELASKPPIRTRSAVTSYLGSKTESSNRAVGSIREMENNEGHILDTVAGGEGTRPQSTTQTIISSESITAPPYGNLIDEFKQLCDKTKNVSMSSVDGVKDRERLLKSSRDFFRTERHTAQPLNQLCDKPANVAVYADGVNDRQELVKSGRVFGRPEPNTAHPKRTSGDELNNQLCDETKNVDVDHNELLNSAKKMLGNVVVSRMGIGRRPLVPSISNERPVDGNLVASSIAPPKPMRKSFRVRFALDPTDIQTATTASNRERRSFDDGESFENVVSEPVIVGFIMKTPEQNVTNTSTDENVLRSSTVPQEMTTKKRIFNKT